MKILRCIYDLARYNKMNKYISSIEIHVDVLQVLLKAELLKEVKSSSMDKWNKRWSGLFRQPEAVFK